MELISTDVQVSCQWSEWRSKLLCWKRVYDQLKAQWFIPLGEVFKAKQYYASLHRECTLVDSRFNEKRKNSPVIQFADLAHVYGWSMSSVQLPGRTDDSEKALHLNSHISVWLEGDFFTLCISHSLFCANQTWYSADLQAQSNSSPVLSLPYIYLFPFLYV